MPEIVSSEPVTIAVDQGTSATKGLVVDTTGEVLARASVALTQTHPNPGWVEQDPDALLDSVHVVVRTLLDRLDRPVAGIGFSTQRESVLAWDRTTGRPLSPVLSWQDRRTVEQARALAENANMIKRISGLPLDPMFSALKFGCILNDIDADRSKSKAGQIAVGTVDSWLLWNLVGEHRIEVGNASRTQLLELASAAWSDELLELFRIPRACLPEVVTSDAPAATEVFDGIALRGVLGDSHAALYGHGVRVPGEVKATYGTGSSVMGLTDAMTTGLGLVATIAWGTVSGGISRAFEGNILSTGATVVWLSKILGSAPDELAALACTVDDCGGVDIVPAFAGLGAPWWDEQAVGIISGLQLGTDRSHLARAAFESVALQVEDVLLAAEREVGAPLTTLLADGGPSRNSWLMQLQADLSGRIVTRHDDADLSAWGAARFAAVTAGLIDEASDKSHPHTEFKPDPNFDPTRRRDRWAAAVARSRTSDLARR